MSLQRRRGGVGDRWSVDVVKAEVVVGGREMVEWSAYRLLAWLLSRRGRRWDGRLRPPSRPVATAAAGRIIKTKYLLYCKMLYEVPRIGLME